MPRWPNITRNVGRCWQQHDGGSKEQDPPYGWLHSHGGCLHSHSRPRDFDSLDHRAVARVASKRLEARLRVERRECGIAIQPRLIERREGVIDIAESRMRKREMERRHITRALVRTSARDQRLRL